jgi:protein-S-isoprenylcysteine O-methyltransferase Ste14
MMPPDLWIDRTALATVVALMAVGMGRAVFLYARGVHVVVLDWHKPVRRALGDALSLILLIAWFYEVFAHGLPLVGHGDPWSLGVSVIQNSLVRFSGLAILASGLVLYTVALFALGRSWRMGIDVDNPGPLVTTGLYGWSRNPIYAALMLIFPGAFLALGQPVLLLLGSALCLAVHLNALAEERFLTDVYGDAYREYSRTVGRYFTIARSPRS